MHKNNFSLLKATHNKLCGYNETRTIEGNSQTQAQAPGDVKSNFGQPPKGKPASLATKNIQIMKQLNMLGSLEHFQTSAMKVSGLKLMQVYSGVQSE